MENNPLFLNRSSFGNALHIGNILSEKEAKTLLNDWVKNDKLQIHMKQVGHLMKAFATSKGYGELIVQKWYLAGLLHDADWDQWPDQHCKKIIEELESRQIDPEIIRSIASHGPRYFGVEPISEMDKMLYAFDELSGFVHAYSLMRPEGYLGMEVKGVKKRLKDKTFAAQVSREDVRDGSERAGIPLEELIQFVISNQGDADLN
ncbi:Predicted hydrolase, HD superfamily [Algoriphagus alkaliphilus]|uniref:Predicted hydrolase, HD superfamily n=1 Tax=Algoriphagus alkaliphilus TaxID=279824 RepID=A0A1G5YST6_9BACT|nr:HD domain-containing protein [Algoriphagus alkaliphilus]MBA4299281.1 hydrolase [Cyclobacterium sp.]SDA85422.1 Predicted hydrolase, HD superfamily [Algoriphagus alkaliphilus]